MAETTTLNLCILWEDELRTAAKLLREAAALTDDDQRARAMATAYRACQVALYGLKDDSHVVMIGADGLRKRRKAQP